MEWGRLLGLSLLGSSKALKPPLCELFICSGVSFTVSVKSEIKFPEKELSDTDFTFLLITSVQLRSPLDNPFLQR